MTYPPLNLRLGTLPYQKRKEQEKLSRTAQSYSSSVLSLSTLFSSSLCSMSAIGTSSFSLLFSVESLHGSHVGWQEEYSFSLVNEIYFQVKKYIPHCLCHPTWLPYKPCIVAQRFLRFAISLKLCNTLVVVSGLLYANNFSYLFYCSRCISFISIEKM